MYFSYDDMKIEDVFLYKLVKILQVTLLDFQFIIEIILLKGDVVAVIVW